MFCEPIARWTTPCVTRKENELVEPVTYTAPVLSTATPLPCSAELPPRYVDQTSADPAALSLVANASDSPPLKAGKIRLAQKFVEPVVPTIAACLFPSTAMSNPT